MFFYLLLIFVQSFLETQQNIKFTSQTYKVSELIYQVKIIAEIKPTFHIYGLSPYTQIPSPINTSIVFEGSESSILIKSSPSIIKNDPNFNIIVEQFENTLELLYLVKYKEKNNVKLNITYQLCTESFCYPAKTETLESEAVAKEFFKIDNSVNESIKISDFIGLAFLMGFLALLTPCVFPMIPITVSFFIKQEKKQLKSALLESLIYGLGIILTFTLFGLLIARFFGAQALQNFVAHPYTNIAFAILFILFALSLFDLFELRLPNKLINLAHSKSVGNSRLATIFAGVTFSLVSFTCTVQFVGLLLVSATKGEWFYPVIGLFCFSLAFSLPFIILSMFPQLLNKLPKASTSLEKVKITFAFVELAAAFKFFSQADLVWNLELISRNTFLIIWASLALLIFFYLIDFLKIIKSKSFIWAPFRLFFACCFLFISIYLLNGLNANPLQADIDSYLPPYDYASNYTDSNFNWIEDYKTAINLSKEQNKYIFIDFTGKTCTNCRYMEKNMFTIGEIIAEMNKYIKVRLWTDFGEDKVFNQNLEQSLLQTVALPYYAIVDSNGLLIKSFGGMTRDKTEFLEFLRLKQ